MIRSSRPGDEAGLKHLWQIAFGDPMETVNHFFSRLYQPGDAMVWTERGEIASAIYLLDAGSTISKHGKSLSTAYAYALATLPSYRGRGIGAQVTRAAIEESFARGFSCNVICPAAESLFPFYTRLGYTHTIPIVQGEVQRDESQIDNLTYKIMSTPFSAYFPLRHAQIPPTSTAYPPKFLRYLEESAQSAGGGFVQLDIGGQRGCAAVEWRDSKLFLREILPSSIALQGVQALMAHFDAPAAIFRTISGPMLPPGCASRPFALLAYPGRENLETGDWYFPFVLD